MTERRLDVSDLEAPEPLVRAIAALQTLPDGDYLRLFHRMKPCHLYRFLEENHFHSDTRQGDAVECEVFIWREDDHDAAKHALAVAQQLTPWVE